MRKGRVTALLLAGSLAAVAVATGSGSAGVERGAVGLTLTPRSVGGPVASDTSRPLSDMPLIKARGGSPDFTMAERGLGPVGNTSHQRDGALQRQAVPNAMPAPLFTFEGPSNEDNRRIFGFRVNPPDPNGDVGKGHYVAMVNLTFAIYTKQGGLLFGPADTGTLWQGFPVTDCTDPSGDPIVVYDELSDRWILTQFTTRGPEYFNCVAVSTGHDPLGSYHRYAFSTGPNFPDYPKYGVMDDGLYITTREFAPDDTESIGIYAIDRKELAQGDPDPTVVSFQLTGPPFLVGDGILPADQDGKQRPREKGKEWYAGTMDNDGSDGAPFDAINWFESDVDFHHPAGATFALTAQLPTAPFDSIYPCAPGSRDCLPQPGVVNPAQYLDILSYRQRPTYRLQFRRFHRHESLVTNQSVEARPATAGVRWYEVRNPSAPFIYQQGTWAPTDGVHRWMGSVAMDEDGNMAAGYSVVNGVNVFPGIRYAGRLAGDPPGQLSQGEAVLQNGSGSQLTTNSRWGDYTAMTVDPRDDCTFYYINEYYAITELAAWQTRIGAFKFPSCH